MLKSHNRSIMSKYPFRFCILRIVKITAGHNTFRTGSKLFLTINLLFNCECLDVGSPVQMPTFKIRAKGRGIRDPPRSRINKKYRSGLWRMFYDVQLKKVEKRSNFGKIPTLVLLIKILLSSISKFPDAWFCIRFSRLNIFCSPGSHYNRELAQEKSS